MKKKEKINKESKSIVNKIIIILAVLSTYIMAFLLGKITNNLILGIKDEVKDNPSIVSPTENPIINPDVKPTSSSGVSGVTKPNIEPSVEPQETINPSNTSTPDNPDELDGVIILWENNKRWEQLEELNIFKGKFYQKNYIGKIAPGFSGTYDFVLQNNSNKDINYILSFKEDNPENINMIYTVQSDGEYVLGNSSHSVYIDGVKLEEVKVLANSKVYYKLNWKWEDTNYDTQIGEKTNAKYKITIKIQATEAE